MSRLVDAIRRARSLGNRDPDGDPGPKVELEGRRVLLVYLFGALGDAILLAPVVRALLESGARSPVGLLVRPSAARALELVDLPMRVHVLPDALYLPPERPRDEPSRKAWRRKEVKASAAKLTAALERARYDIAADLTFRADVDARRWVVGSGASVRLGFVHAGETAREVGLTHGTIDTREQGERHWSRYLVLPLGCLGVKEPRYDVPFVASSPREVARAADLLDRRPRVLLIPGARNEAKRWDPERFVEVGRWVVGDALGSVVVAGAPGEASLIRSVAKGIGAGAAAYTGKSLSTLLALIEAADAVVTNDTGPMHIAFLREKPTVAVFTWMSAVCWGPPRPGPRFVVLNAPERRSSVDGAGDAWTRAVLHYLQGLLARDG